MTTEYRNSDQLTDEERATQLQHVLRKLERALDYVVAQARDTLTFGEMPWTSTVVSFQLPGVEPVKIEVNLEMWTDDTLTIHIKAAQLNGAGYYSSLFPRNRGEFKKLFAKYNPKRMRIEDGLNTAIFLPLTADAA
jgi:hypothetical protein